MMYYLMAIVMFAIYFFIFKIFVIDRSIYVVKQNKFGYSSCNRMEVIDKLKIEDGGRPPCWIFNFATHSLSCRKF